MRGSLKEPRSPVQPLYCFVLPERKLTWKLPVPSPLKPLRNMQGRLAGMVYPAGFVPVAFVASRIPHTLSYLTSDSVPDRDRTRPSFEFAMRSPHGSNEGCPGWVPS
jgi:hypothetical protein